ncbi:MAG: LptF/LptG family permease, partial [Bacteroidales bacterium]
FITVIFFTSKMAYNTEIIAMLSNGMSFNRLLWPYFLGALMIAIFTFAMNNFIIPHANKERLEFEEVYYRNSPVSFTGRNIHKQVLPNVYIYMESYSNIQDVGYKFAMEEFTDSGELKSKMIGDYIKWDTTLNKWTVRNYYIRKIEGMKETIEKGRQIDTTLNIFPSDFARRDNIKSTMNLQELNLFIAQQKLQGADNVEVYMIERYGRFAMPFSTFILTLIGLTLSSKKAKGGIGVQIGAGIFLSFSYIFFMQFSSQFAISGSIPSLLAVWIPNILYLIIGILLYRVAPK